MDRDAEQLNLLAIFHYVVAGLAGSSLFPLSFIQPSALRSYLPRGREQRSQAKNCHPNFLVGFSLCWARCYS
jgi:hypothetical protein